MGNEYRSHVALDRETKEVVAQVVECFLFHSFMAGPAHLVIWFREIPVFHYSKSTFRLGQPES